MKTDKKDAIKLVKYCNDKWNELKAYSMQDSIYENLGFYQDNIVDKWH